MNNARDGPRLKKRQGKMVYVVCCVLDQVVGYISIQGDITLVPAEARFYKTYDEAQKSFLDNYDDWFVSEVKDPLFFITESDECRMPSDEVLKYATYGTESDKESDIEIDNDVLSEYGF